MLDFEGLEVAKELLISPKKRRIEAGVDPMLSNQGLNPEQRRLKTKMRIERIGDLKNGVRSGLEKMRAMAAEGYDTRQIGLRLIVPQMGKKVRAQQRKLSVQEKAKDRISKALVRRKATKAEAKAKAKAKAKAMAKVSPEDSVELEEAAEEACVLPEEACVLPEEQWEDS